MRQTANRQPTSITASLALITHHSARGGMNERSRGGACDVLDDILYFIALVHEYIRTKLIVEEVTRDSLESVVRRFDCARVSRQVCSRSSCT